MLDLAFKVLNLEKNYYDLISEKMSLRLRDVE